MRNFCGILCCIIITGLLAGCGGVSTDDSAPFRRYPNFQAAHPKGKLITDPYFWSRLQFANGDVFIEGANPDAYPICYANADINGAPGDELFIRDDIFGEKCHRVMVFMKENGGYRFIGWFDAAAVTITDKGMIVTGPAEGTTTMLREYRYDSKDGAGRLVAVSSTQLPMTVGRDAPEKNNEYYANLIKNGKALRWTEY